MGDTVVVERVLALVLGHEPRTMVPRPEKYGRQVPDDPPAADAQSALGIGDHVHRGPAPN